MSRRMSCGASGSSRRSESGAASGAGDIDTRERITEQRDLRWVSGHLMDPDFPGMQGIS